MQPKSKYSTGYAQHLVSRVVVETIRVVRDTRSTCDGGIGWRCSLLRNRRRRRRWCGSGRRNGGWRGLTVLADEQQRVRRVLCDALRPPAEQLRFQTPLF